MNRWSVMPRSANGIGRCELWIVWNYRLFWWRTENKLSHSILASIMYASTLHFSSCIQCNDHLKIFLFFLSLRISIDTVNDDAKRMWMRYVSFVEQFSLEIFHFFRICGNSCSMFNVHFSTQHSTWTLALALWEILWWFYTVADEWKYIINHYELLPSHIIFTVTITQPSIKNQTPSLNHLHPAGGFFPSIKHVELIEWSVE